VYNLRGLAGNFVTHMGLSMTYKSLQTVAQVIEVDPSHFLLIILIPVLSVKFFANTDIETPKIKLNDSRNLTVISVMIVSKYYNNCTI